MNWVKKCKILAIETIQYKEWPCIELDDLWWALHSSFNSAQLREVNILALNKIPNKPTKVWNSFSKQELIDAIEKCNKSSAPDPDKLIWSHIKSIVNNKECVFKLLEITNAYIELGHWLSHFKMSTIVIISKPNKSIYDSPKAYYPIVLLNTIGKLFKKMISECLQFHTIANNLFIKANWEVLNKGLLLMLESSLLTSFVQNGLKIWSQACWHSTLLNSSPS